MFHLSYLSLAGIINGTSIIEATYFSLYFGLHSFRGAPAHLGMSDIVRRTRNLSIHPCHRAQKTAELYTKTKSRAQCPLNKIQWWCFHSNKSNSKGSQKDLHREQTAVLLKPIVILKCVYCIMNRLES